MSTTSTAETTESSAAKASAPSASSASPEPEELSRVDSREEARRERIERRQAQILEAAARIMYDTGFHGMSMQAVAERAGMSVGLIYQYFAGKDEVLEAVIVEILDDFRVLVPAAMDAAGEDPEQRLRAGFAAFCKVIDARREAALLAYRESQTLSPQGRAKVTRMEEETTEPFREAVRAGTATGQFRAVSPELVAHNLKMAAHAWALKHWALAPHLSLDEYIEAEIDLTLSAIRAERIPSSSGGLKGRSRSGR
ncbi:MAG: TetR/AcrR family transcriptional regulator [Actinomycetales bacterium]|nr:TetR/AcrR family transcriptional regulator [Tetrasphaera sp.]NLW98936.1 TetR/AcrR family transcriptional regulator [Actinomycetales bacterium]